MEKKIIKVKMAVSANLLNELKLARKEGRAIYDNPLHHVPPFYSGEFRYTLPSKRKITKKR